MIVFSESETWMHLVGTGLDGLGILIHHVNHWVKDRALTDNARQLFYILLMYGFR